MWNRAASRDRRRARELLGWALHTADSAFPAFWAGLLLFQDRAGSSEPPKPVPGVCSSLGSPWRPHVLPAAPRSNLMLSGLLVLFFSTRHFFSGESSVIENFYKERSCCLSGRPGLPQACLEHQMMWWGKNWCFPQQWLVPVCDLVASFWIWALCDTHSI